MYPVRTLLLVVLAGCGRFGFDAAALADVDAAPPDPLADGLALHVTFDDGHADASGHGHPTACEGTCPGTAEGWIGRAGVFAGRECIVVTDHEDLRPAVFTLAVWARPAIAQSATVFGRPFESATNFENSFELYMGRGEWITIVGSHVQMAGTAQLETWTHLVATYDGTRTGTYVDGVAVATNPAAVSFTLSEPLRIGCDRDYGQVRSWFTGDIDDVRLYTRVLMDDEIAALARR